MLTRVIVPALLGALVLSAPVLAAERADTFPSPYPKAYTDAKARQDERCTELETQFDGAIKDHSNADKAGEARTFRREGGEMCTNGRQFDGILKLEQAIRDIGLTPTEG
jgi:hypothetical protein